MDILIDIHEPNTIVKQFERQDHKLDHKITGLKVGDFVCGNVGVERKTMTDLCGSIYSGRVWRQLQELRATYENPWLLLEGSLNQCRNSKERKLVLSSQITVQRKFGVPVVRVDAKSDIPYTIWKMVEEKKAGQRPILVRRRSQLLSEIQEDIVSRVPLIGLGKAKELLNGFGSVQEVVNADAESLQKTKGIGNAAAMRMVTVMQSPYEPPEKNKSKKR